eukprot:3940375-Rhodomonas_salina.6
MGARSASAFPSTSVIWRVRQYQAVRVGDTVGGSGGFVPGLELRLDLGPVRLVAAYARSVPDIPYHARSRYPSLVPRRARRR